MTTVEHQYNLELDMLAQARVRQAADNTKSSNRDAWGESKMGSQYVRTAATKFSEAVHAFMNQPASVGRQVRAAKMLKDTGLEPETIAFLFTKHLYSSAPFGHKAGRLKRVTVCIKGADLIHDEWRIRFFSDTKERKSLLKKLFKDFDKRQYPRHWRLNTIKNYFHAEMLEWSAWGTKEKLAVGYALLILFRDSTGLIKTDKSSIYVEFTQELLDHMEETIKTRVQDYMLYLPMVVPPRPWKEEYLFRGGYLNAKTVKPYPIIKGSRKRDIPRFVSMDWSRILPAINAMQETGWRINSKVADILHWAMMERGGGVAGLPLSSDRPLPPEPYNYRTDEAVKKQHNHVCFLVHDENRRAKSKRLAVLMAITLAQKFRNFDAIYFPHNLDTRGRAYPVPAILNPQGPDHVKAMLEFSRGLPIETEEQAAWLAIAGANAYGQDKVSLQERVDWVQDNEELIFSIAEDSKSDLRWMEASEPFQFLRFCFEWKAFWERGLGFVSHMVVPVDATCSGLQHYSAMLRDEVGGRSVNLVPGLPRQDIYQDVADRVVEKLMDTGDDMSHDWIKFGIDRKITKRQVMVVPYAGTFSSCMAYTREAVTEKLVEGHPCPWQTDDSEEHTKRVVFLSKLIWEAIDEVVVKGKEAMKWLTDAARAYTKWANKNIPGNAFDRAMTWETPDGFQAIHFRAALEEKRINTKLDGRVVLTYYDDALRLDTSDMALAVAPNFVHSLDACLLRASIIEGLNHGIAEFGMVHDSFGVHAARMPRFLKDCVKPAFVQMYEGDVLAQFKARLPKELALPDLPQKGTLDVMGVLQSEFFFS